jgi:hypothetical protein
MTTCTAKTFNTTRDIVHSLELTSNRLCGFIGNINAGHRSLGHLFWAIPSNILLNAATFVIAPIVALVQLLAAAVFAMFSCCSEEAKAYAKISLALAAHALLDTPIKAAIRIFDPTYRVHNPILNRVADCLGFEAIEVF